MERKANDVQSVHLEVQDEGTRWQSMGQVQLLIEDGIPFSSSTAQVVHRNQLPRSVKRLLAPIADQRKHNYLFRHAPATQPNTNLMILLHGAGDTHVPFDKLGRSMELPQTATLSISAKGYEKLAFDLGYTWFQEMDYVTGTFLPDNDSVRCRSLKTATQKLYNILEDLILKEQWIIPERVFFLGYGAGAALAMQLAVLWSDRDHPPFGGTICVAGGAILEEQQQKEPIHKRMTPILLMVGEKDEMMTSKKVQELRRCYGKDAEVYVEPNKGKEMIQSQREMQRVMEFLSQRLVRVSSMPC